MAQHLVVEIVLRVVCEGGRRVWSNRKLLVVSGEVWTQDLCGDNTNCEVVSGRGEVVKTQSVSCRPLYVWTQNGEWSTNPCE